MAQQGPSAGDGDRDGPAQQSLLDLDANSLISILKFLGKKDLASLQLTSVGLHTAARAPLAWSHVLHDELGISLVHEGCPDGLDAQDVVKRLTTSQLLYDIRYQGVYTDGGMDSFSIHDPRDNVFWVDNAFVTNHWSAYCSDASADVNCIALLQPRDGAAPDTELSRHRAYLVERCKYAAAYLFGNPNVGKKLLLAAEEKLRQWSTTGLERFFHELWADLNAHPASWGSLLLTKLNTKTAMAELSAKVEHIKQLNAIRFDIAPTSAESPLQLVDRKALGAMQAQGNPSVTGVIQELRISRQGHFTCPVRCGAVLVGQTTAGPTVARLQDMASEPYCKALNGIQDVDVLKDACAEGRLPPILAHHQVPAGEWVEFAPLTRKERLQLRRDGLCFRPVVWFRFFTKVEAPGEQGPPPVQPGDMELFDAMEDDVNHGLLPDVGDDDEEDAEWEDDDDDDDDDDEDDDEEDEDGFAEEGEEQEGEEEHDSEDEEDEEDGDQSEVLVSEERSEDTPEVSEDQGSEAHASPPQVFANAEEARDDHPGALQQQEATPQQCVLRQPLSPPAQQQPTGSSSGGSSSEREQARLQQQQQQPSGAAASSASPSPLPSMASPASASEGSGASRQLHGPSDTTGLVQPESPASQSLPAGMDSEAGRSHLAGPSHHTAPAQLAEPSHLPEPSHSNRPAHPTSPSHPMPAAEALEGGACAPTLSSHPINLDAPRAPRGSADAPFLSRTQPRLRAGDPGGGRSGCGTTVVVLPPPSAFVDPARALQRAQVRPPVQQPMTLKLGRRHAGNAVCLKLICPEDRMQEFEDDHSDPNIDIEFCALVGFVAQFPDGTQLA